MSQFIVQKHRRSLKIRTFGKFRFATAASAIALLSAIPTISQAAEAQSAQPAAEEIIVTGSRIVRDGYEAPTPVTVVGVEQIQDTAKPSIADVLNQMPVFQGSLTPGTSGAQNSGKSGGNNLNLRNLGANRALILFDGRRVPPEFVDGSVDVNLLPDALISRVDVVTGGASAVYGSDAVAGVVNFILDTDFTGVKGLVQGGVTQKGDGRNLKLQLAAGTNFANDRGHFLIEGDYAYQAPIAGTARDWNMTGYYGILNPAYTATNGLPQYIFREQIGHSNGYAGGIISGGPLKGIAFGPGGTPFNYDYGTLVNNSYHQGGDWRGSTQAGATNIMVGSNMVRLFTFGKYDVTDDIQLYAEFSNSQVKTRSRCCFVYYLGNLTVSPDNPFMPESVAARARALGLTSLPFGEILHYDDVGFGTVLDRMNNVYTFGAKGKFDAFETAWSWDAYIQRGIAKLSFWVPYQPNNDRFALAIDAVRTPTGSIGCRVNFDANPANDAPGCVPYNIFGIGVASQPAFDYIMGGPYGGPNSSQTISQNVAGISATGEPFSTWAGPLSLAFSGEYRKDSVNGRNDPVSPVRGWYSTQLTTFPAKNSVIEGAVEALVPLAKDASWARSLDLNAAVRLTDYEASGFVSTWKAGLTYTPIDDVRVRLTQSRDIRAPSLTDLYSTPQTNHSTIPDPFRGNVASPYYNISQGNPNLKPEKADTTGIGVVYQPSWFSGFSASVDYYRINIKGAITVVAFADVLNKCFAGDTSYCADVIREPDGTLDSIFSRPQNAAKLLAKGIDFEASYNAVLSDFVSSWDGNLNLRLVATNTLNLITDTGIAGTTQILDEAGFGNVPKWSVTGTASYSLQDFRFAWTQKYISPTKIQNTRIECLTNCPSIRGFTTVDNNSRPSYWLTNISMSYRFYQDGTNNAETFLSVDNLFDRKPPLSPIFGATTYNIITSAALYDTLGRQFRAGVRFRM